MLVSLVLVIVCTVLAFTPLFKIRVSDETIESIENLMSYVVKSEGEDPSETQAAVNKIIESMNLKEASVSLSLFGMTSSAKPIIGSSDAITDMVKAFTTGASGETEHADEMFTEALKKVKEVFLTEDGEIRSEVRDFVVVIAAIVGPMLPSADDISGGMSEGDIPSLAAKAIPHLLALVVAMIMAVLIPIIYAILFLVTLITFLKNLREPDIGAAKLAKRMPKSIVHPLAIMLVPCLSSGFAYTTSVLIMAILAAVGTLVNVVFTRMHSWEKEDIAYANVVQATSLFSIGAYLFLFFNILKMGIFNNFIGKFISFFIGTSTGTAPGTSVYKDAGMILIAVIFAFVSVKYLAKVLRRVSLACKPKKKGARATHLVYALFLVLVTVFPMMALGSTANNGGSFLSLSLAQEYALLYGFIATCLMVLSEIVLLILRKVFGKNMTTAAIADVLSGVSVGPEAAAEAEVPVDAADTAEEAPAEAATEEVSEVALDEAEAPSEAAEEGSVADDAASSEDKE